MRPRYRHQIGRSGESLESSGGFTGPSAAGRTPARDEATKITILRRTARVRDHAGLAVGPVVHDRQQFGKVGAQPGVQVGARVQLAEQLESLHFIVGRTCLSDKTGDRIWRARVLS